MKKILTSYLFIVSFAYLTVGVGTLVYISNIGVSSFFLVRMILVAAVYNIFFLVPFMVVDMLLGYWFGYAFQILFGIVGILGVIFIIKQDPLGIKIWFLLSYIVAAMVLCNFFILGINFVFTLPSLRIYIGGTIMYSLISIFLALTYFFSIRYIKSKMVNKSAN